MFILSKLETLVKVDPHKFNISHPDIVNFELCRRFSNKVLYNVGLSICLYDITNKESCFLFPGEGAYHILVEFRCIVFRPFVNEVIIGKILSSSPQGLIVSVGGFFNYVYISNDELQEPSEYDKKENLWMWKYEMDDEDSGIVIHDLYIEIGETIKFKVIQEQFNDINPKDGDEDFEGIVPVATENCNIDPIEKKSPYVIFGSISEEGLGPLKWWN